MGEGAARGGKTHIGKAPPGGWSSGSGSGSVAGLTSEGLVAGRATDARVARLVGWTHVGRWRGNEPIGRDEWVGVPPGGIEAFHRGERDSVIAWLPLFSSDPRAAEQLQRDVLRRFGLQCTLTHEALVERCALHGADGTHIEGTAPAGEPALATCAAIIAALSMAPTRLAG